MPKCLKERPNKYDIENTRHPFFFDRRKSFNTAPIQSPAPGGAPISSSQDSKESSSGLGRLSTVQEQEIERKHVGRAIFLKHSVLLWRAAFLHTHLPRREDPGSHAMLSGGTAIQNAHSSGGAPVPATPSIKVAADRGDLRHRKIKPLYHKMRVAHGSKR